jgi:hypothetical protein
MICRHSLLGGFRMRAACCLLTASALVAAFASAAAAQEQQKFAAALFHCNLQYVEGGTLGMLPLPGLLNVFPNWEQGNNAIEDMIIERSFEPLLDLYAKHPTWGLDIEMESYYLEVLAARHPTVLAKLIQLIQNNQAEVISFHYSAQFFLAYGRTAWDHSVAEVKADFTEYGVPLSDVVFAQEGQSGMGMATAMAANGYKHMVWPKNLWIYQHGSFTPAPLYAFGNLDMVPAPLDINYNNGQLQLTWTYLDDQEIWATNGIDPYFPPFFITCQSCIDAYETQLEQLETNGYKIARVTDYIAAVNALNIAPAAPPPLFDGTWQPSSTDGVHRWLGGLGTLFFESDGERDNHVHTLNEIAFRELQAAETIATVAGLSVADEIDVLWHLLNLGMGSDATGVNPIGSEAGFGISHAAEVARRAREIIEEGKTKLGLTTAAIDIAAGTAVAGTAPAEPPIVASGPVEPQIDVTGRVATSTWRQSADNPQLWRLDIGFSAGANRTIAVTFPGTSTEVVFTHALVDNEPVIFNRSDFTFDHWWMPLPNGMLNLDDDLFVIADLSMVHVAAKIVLTDGSATFQDDTATVDSAINWRFYFLRGTPADALAFANGLNIQPTLVR